MGHGGVVARELSFEPLATAIEMLMCDYEALACNAAQIGPAEFSINTMIENYRRLYAL